MNQEKIGKFISSCRKKQNLTQERLAEKLNITAKAVSKWETGKSLPDPSIMIELCNILKITVNELLSGEKLDKKQYENKFEENIVNTIGYANKKTKKIVNKFLLAGLIIIILLFTFIVDISRMRNNKSVIFSTWGFKYIPAINIEEEKIENAITNYLIEASDSQTKKYDTEKTFVSFRTYLIEEEEKETKYNIYAWVLESRYYQKDGAVIEDSSSSIPHKFELKKTNNNYEVLSSRIPRDGSYYNEDIKNIFPYSVRKNFYLVHNDGTIDRLELDIQKQVKLYFHQ